MSLLDPRIDDALDQHVDHGYCRCSACFARRNAEVRIDRRLKFGPGRTCHPVRPEALDYMRAFYAGFLATCAEIQRQQANRPKARQERVLATLNPLGREPRRMNPAQREVARLAAPFQRPLKE